LHASRLESRPQSGLQFVLRIIEHFGKGNPVGTQKIPALGEHRAKRNDRLGWYRDVTVKGLYAASRE
jgi:hypothetical protein